MAAGEVATSLSSRSRALPAIAVGGFIVGVLDLLYAIVVYSPKQPILIPQTIAAGVLGPKSYDGGIRTAILGVFLHFVIAFGAATIYYLASRKLPYLVDDAFVCGLVYGALVFSFTHVIIVPLSNAPHGNMPTLYRIAEFVWHWFGVGLPISFSVRHYSK
jgi:hypothetical protein